MQRHNGIPDFRENGVKRCARLESKKSASSAVKKKLRGGMVANNLEGGGGALWPPPPGAIRVKLALKVVLQAEIGMLCKVE